MNAPRVSFYVLPEADERARLVYACRLVEKAYLQDNNVLVRCDSPEQAREFDELLWVFSDDSFVPHELAAEGTRRPAPVMICAGDEDALEADVLVNLGREPPATFRRHARVAEILDGDEDRRRAGRERFRFYREQGLEPETHNLGRS